MILVTLQSLLFLAFFFVDHSAQARLVILISLWITQSAFPIVTMHSHSLLANVELLIVLVQTF